MITAILDTTVILRLFRKYPPALNCLNNQQHYGIASITWLEVMEGASSKLNQVQCRSLLRQFELLLLTAADQQGIHPSRSRCTVLVFRSKYAGAIFSRSCAAASARMALS